MVGGVSCVSGDLVNPVVFMLKNAINANNANNADSSNQCCGAGFQVLLPRCPAAGAFCLNLWSINLTNIN